MIIQLGQRPAGSAAWAWRTIVSICVEQLPARPLREFVECIWYSDPSEETAFDIVPDGCVDVCYVLSERQPRTLCFGTTTRTSRYEMEAGAPYFGVRFRPGYASMFVPEKISNLTDTQCETPAFLGLGAEEVAELKDFSRRRERLESELLTVLSRTANRAGNPVSRAVSAINARSGDIRIRELAAFCGVSERQLERLFREQVGIAPKLYARIRRFRSVLDSLDDPSGMDLPKMADLAASYGYADQSHLARELRSFSHSPLVPA
jgi:methylphosphotriester-DNA--protein-cysteine methyltransferase